MGVKDLWKLLESTCRPVSLEQLQGLVIAIDVSVWLHQAVHGARDAAGQPLQSAHLALLFSRICKLLHYQIKPVFVFDGGTPALKQLTLAQRNRRRQVASKKGQKAEEKQRTKYMQAKILEQLTGEKSSVTAPRGSSQPDIFDLPSLPDDVFNRDRSPVLDTSIGSYVEDVSMVDVESTEFTSLPPEVQHEILQERQEMERYSHTDPGSLPTVANDFSNYQLNKLMKRSKLNRQLEDVRKTLKSNETSVRVLGGEGGGKSLSCEVESNRIMSSDSAHYILVKGVDLKTGSSQDELHEEEKDESGAKKERNDHDVMLDRNDVVVNTKDDRLGTRFRKELGSSLESSVPQNESKNERLISESTSNNEAFTNETSMRSRESEVNVYKDEPQLPHTVCTTTSPSHNTSTKAVLSLEPVSESSQGISSFSDVMVSEDGSDLIPAGIATTTDSQQHSTATMQGSKTDDISHSTTVPDSGHVELQTNDDQMNSDLPSLTCTSVGNERQLELKTDAIEGSGIGVNGEHGGTGETDRFGGGDGGRESGKVGESSDSGEVWESGGGGFEIGGEVGDGSGTPDIGEGGEADDGSCVGDGGEVGDMRDGGEVSEVGVVGDGDKVGDDGEVSEVGDGGEISEVGDGDKVGDDGEVSEVGDGHKVGDDGEVSEVGSEVGDGGEVGDNGGEWEEYVLQMSPSTAQFHLRQEVGELSRETQRQKRAAASLNSQVYREAQELLSLFGLPYIISPMEAEAQCAFLDHTHQTHGSITDDSDVFLFGGQRAYRHFFSQDKEPMFYDASDIESVLGLTRARMVCLAYLLGSDYTHGLEGVGVVNAMEVIGQFRGEGIDTLEKLKEWHTIMNSTPGLTTKSSLEKKLLALELPTDFPSLAVWQAYMNPEVDESTEQFQWGSPDLDLIRKFMSGHVGWNQDRVDSVLLPLLKRVNNRERKITSYSSTIIPSNHLPVIKSRRLRNVVARITDTGFSSNQDGEDGTAATTPKPKRLKTQTNSSSSDDDNTNHTSVRKRGRRGRGRGRRGVRGGRKGRRSPDYIPSSGVAKLSASSSSSDEE